MRIVYDAGYQAMDLLPPSLLTGIFLKIESLYHRGDDSQLTMVADSLIETYRTYP
jgi:hypothetical protein